MLNESEKSDDALWIFVWSYFLLTHLLLESLRQYLFSVTAQLSLWSIKAQVLVYPTFGVLLLSIHARYETWKPGRYQTKAQLADREPQVSFEPSLDFSNEDFFFWISTISNCGFHRNVEGRECRFLILNNLSAVIHVDATILSVIRFNDARLIDPTGSLKKKSCFQGRPLRTATWAHPGLETHSSCEVRCG